jgi:hypothetical protein
MEQLKPPHVSALADVVQGELPEKPKSLYMQNHEK